MHGLKKSFNGLKNNLKMKKKLLLALCFLTSLTFGQVSINTINQNPNVLLHVSERMDESSPVVLKGIMIPKLTEEERNELTYENPLANPKVLKLFASDNSLMIYNTSEDCYNYWNFLEEEWKSLCGNVGNAKFTFDCVDISVFGSYIKEVSTNSSNYISLKVNVTKRGNYIITSSPVQENGYSFVGQGIFTDLGVQEIKLMAQGKPVNNREDTLYITSSELSNPNQCPIKINVLENKATYSLNCSSIKVDGAYVKNNTLTSTHKITLQVNVSKIGSYSISTGIVNGISFLASGNFSFPGVQEIVLQGNGTPTVNDSFLVKIDSNSDQGNTTCEALITVTLPAMTYAVLGANNAYSWHPNSVRAKAFNSTSFGPNGIVKIISLTNVWSTTSAAAAVTNLNSSPKPDVIFFYSYETTITVALTNALNEYVNQGGVLIYGTKDNNNTEANAFLQGIFGVGNAERQISGSGSTDDNVYKISNSPLDPIINGPFGNLADKYWGEDNGSTGSIVVTKLPANSVQVVVAFNETSKQAVDPSYSLVWYNNSKNFVYFGDSVGAAENNTSLLDFPASYNNGQPLSKRYGQYPNQNNESRYTFNSALELNVVAWALKKAAVSGINPH